VLTAAVMFEKFKGTGLLFEATWLPAGSVTPSPVFEVRLMTGDTSGIGLISANEINIQFAAADATGIAQGDTITAGGRTYLLRDRDEANCSADGTLLSYRCRVKQ